MIKKQKKPNYNHIGKQTIEQRQLK